ncbi:tyrosine-type recombinase/integrase [Muribaculum sp. NM65_B17]|uniref:tyrosine-type recombinase/integrase n=1 Tax=Muribaculum sp. NM65_B17 TaxID=2516961 RepID=UPI0010935FD7|nr:tyrosine-type recombinase/integrase [Muribaculum sp. NM65_B17]TGY04150.1 site-specific integrase [Muribaculum sp. NM65_B17]THG43191.1 site-specific integrase [Muribaculaceae bacterium]
MSVKGTKTTADYIEWNTMLSLIRRLYKDGDYTMSLFIGCGCFFGLRVSDLRRLTWRMLLDTDRFTITEQKTTKLRTVKVNADFRTHIEKCKMALGVEDLDALCFLSRKKMVYSTQRINIRLKEIKDRYHIKVDNFSCHSLRKAFGRRVFEQSGENAQLALVKLSELFNHSSVAITKIYLGLREKELLETYDLLDF